MDKLNSLYDSVRPFKQIIRVFAISYDSNGKIMRRECGDFLATEVTNRGLMGVPINPDWGVSNDTNAASFFPFPEYRKDANYEYKIWKELN